MIAQLLSGSRLAGLPATEQVHGDPLRAGAPVRARAAARVPASPAPVPSLAPPPAIAQSAARDQARPPPHPHHHLMYHQEFPHQQPRCGLPVTASGGRPCEIRGCGSRAGVCRHLNPERRKSVIRAGMVSAIT